MTTTAHLPGNTPVASPAPGSAGRRRLPAEPGLWGFLLADMTVFAGFFAFYLWSLGDSRAAFAADASQLIVPLGLINTLVLLASSWTVVRAVRAHSAGDWHAARTWLRLTLVGAAAFVVIKFSEYGVEIAHGHTMMSSGFFMFYFVLTAMHLMHVTIGTGLVTRWYHSLRPGGRPASLLWSESAAGYWHMVDLLWLIIFSFLYIGSHS
jgi:nitric oxide reductase NorE protein